jgi:hypothetical protein
VVSDDVRVHQLTSSKPYLSRNSLEQISRVPGTEFLGQAGHLFAGQVLNLA